MGGVRVMWRQEVLLPVIPFSPSGALIGQKAQLIASGVAGSVGQNAGMRHHQNALTDIVWHLQAESATGL